MGIQGKIYITKEGNSLIEVEKGVLRSKCDYFEFDKNGNLIGISDDFSKNDFNKIYGEKYKDAKTEHCGSTSGSLGINNFFRENFDIKFGKMWNDFKDNLLKPKEKYTKTPILKIGQDLEKDQRVLLSQNASFKIGETEICLGFPYFTERFVKLKEGESLTIGKE